MALRWWVRGRGTAGRGVAGPTPVAASRPRREREAAVVVAQAQPSAAVGGLRSRLYW